MALAGLCKFGRGLGSRLGAQTRGADHLPLTRGW